MAGRSTAVASSSAGATVALEAPDSLDTPETDAAPDVSVPSVATDGSVGCSVLAQPASARVMQHVEIRVARMTNHDTSIIAATIFLPR